MNEIDLIETIELEKDLSPDYLERLSVLGQLVRFEANHYVFHQGETASNVFVLTHGSLKTTRTDERGHDTLLKLHQVGSLVGLSALRPNAKRDANCIAVGNAKARYFRRSEFLDLMRRDGELGLLLVQLLLKRQQLLHSRVSDATGLSVEQRLAQVLVQMHLELNAKDATPDGEPLRITHEDLAALVFSRRQYITSFLSKFSKAGLLRSKRQQIWVLDVERLLNIVSQ